MLVILRRYRAAEYGPLAKELEDIPGCRVILDRRMADRRGGRGTRRLADRRRRERRAARLEDSDGLGVIFARGNSKAGSAPLPGHTFLPSVSVR
jgi:hypothetical protein